MTTFIRIPRLAGLAAAAFLAGCGNDPGALGGDRILAQLRAALPSASQAQPTTLSDAQIAQVLNATDVSVLAGVIEDRQSQAILTEIERNGDYITYATPTRQTIVARNGFVTSTRGLGGDVMSSGSDGVLSLLQARQAGSAQYVQRFLTADDRTEQHVYDCTVSPGQTIPLNVGTLSGQGRVMQMACTGPKGSITGTFVVDTTGYVVTARQWLGERTGYVGFQTLRK